MYWAWITDVMFAGLNFYVNAETYWMTQWEDLMYRGLLPGYPRYKEKQNRFTLN
jgi:hypothetical protein